MQLAAQTGSLEYWENVGVGVYTAGTGALDPDVPGLAGACLKSIVGHRNKSRHNNTAGETSLSSLQLGRKNMCMYQ